MKRSLITARQQGCVVPQRGHRLTVTDARYQICHAHHFSWSASRPTDLVNTTSIIYMYEMPWYACSSKRQIYVTLTLLLLPNTCTCTCTPPPIPFTLPIYVYKHIRFTGLDPNSNISQVYIYHDLIARRKGIPQVMGRWLEFRMRSCDCITISSTADMESWSIYRYKSLSSDSTNVNIIDFKAPC